MELSVEIADPYIVGQTRGEYAKVIPITGGTFCGQNLNGTVLPGGADWNTVSGKGAEDLTGIRHVFAKYVIRTDMGVCIAVENEGWKSMSSDNVTAIATVPKFQTAAPEYDWLNWGVYVGSLTPRPDNSGVTLRFYRLN
ncbi:MAG: DUF3237 domain-containing protein [Lawsonibacter sp.]